MFHPDSVDNSQLITSCTHDTEASNAVVAHYQNGCVRPPSVEEIKLGANSLYFTGAKGIV